MTNRGSGEAGRLRVQKFDSESIGKSGMIVSEISALSLSLKNSSAHPLSVSLKSVTPLVSSDRNLSISRVDSHRRIHQLFTCSTRLGALFELLSPSKISQWGCNVPQKVPTVSRKWEEIAAEATREEDPNKTLELIEELNAALELQIVKTHPTRKESCVADKKAG